MSEGEVEPIPGLPERPPEGEEILWQGSPRWWPLARRAFRVTTVTAYFGVAMAAVLAADVWNGEPAGPAFLSALWLLVPAALAVGLLSGLAWLYARMTVYTITSERLVVRSGIALPTAINLPFARIASAALKEYRDGTGDIALAMEPGSERPSLVMLWPHVRPFRWRRPEPALRSVPDAAGVAETLATALTARAGDDGAATTAGDAQEGGHGSRQRSRSNRAAMA